MPYIFDLDVAVPADNLLVSAVPDAIRDVTLAVKSSFPNVAGAVNASDVELEYVNGVTSAIQTQLNAKSALAPAAEPTVTFEAAVTSGYAHIVDYDNDLTAIEIGGAISQVVGAGAQMTLSASLTAMSAYYPPEAAASLMLIPCQFVTSLGYYVPGFIDFNAVGIQLICWNPSAASLTLTSFCARGVYKRA